MYSLIFFRQFPSFKSPGFSVTPSKCHQLYGSLRYFRSHSQKLAKRPVYSENFCQRHANNFNEFKVLKRYKQTSSAKEQNSENVSTTTEEPTEKLSLFKRYQKMLKEYWYVLLPVHCVTSAFWFGGFYYAAKCGIDIVPFLEYINVPEKFIKPLRSSSLGYIAVASAFYKLATPARYMVTLGGTTFAIKFLTKRGLIRPVPTKAEIKTIIQNKLKKDVNEKQQ